jgi:hypothetical protein
MIFTHNKKNEPKSTKRESIHNKAMNDISSNQSLKKQNIINFPTICVVGCF